MFKKSQILFYIAETSIHAGSGSELGLVDLPIQREVHTEFPVIRGSTLKGAFRKYYQKVAEEKATTIEEEKKKLEAKYLDIIFGPERIEEEKSFASAISFTDARILLFPVKSVKRIFTYITCPFVLKRLVEDLKWAGHADKAEFEIPEVEEGKAVISSKEVQFENKLILEEFKFEAENEASELARQLAELIFGKENGDFRKEKVEKHLAIVSDTDFVDFVKYSTEVVARIRVDKSTGTVEPGGLWYEENLPSEAILYNIILFSDSRKSEDNSSAETLMEKFNEILPSVIQLGGNETIGRGFLKVIKL